MPRHASSAWKYIPWSYSNVNVTGQSSRSQEESVAKVVSASSREGVLVRVHQRQEMTTFMLIPLSLIQLHRPDYCPEARSTLCFNIKQPLWFLVITSVILKILSMTDSRRNSLKRGVYFQPQPSCSCGKCLVNRLRSTTEVQLRI